MPRSVLIVEDSPQVAANLEIALAGLGGGLDLLVAPSAIEALRLLELHGSSAFAAVVTDLEMPRMDGFELIRRLRADPRFSTVPIIVSSGSSDPDSPRRALSLGADAYFSKPYSPLELRRTLESLIQDRNHA